METPLLSRVATGDPEAVRACIGRYQGLVWTLASGFFRDRDEAEDAVQEVFIALWKNAGRYDPARGKESTFVGMLARRRLIDRWRRRQRRQDTAPIELEPESNDAAVDERLADAEDARTARALLDTLPEQQRRTIELAVLHGRTHQQISEDLQIPLGTVKAHVRRGLERLRERFASARTSLGGSA